MATKSRRQLEAKSTRRSEGFDGGFEDKLIPLLAIGLGISMGIGLAYMAKKYFLKDLGKAPSVTYVEDRKPRMALQDAQLRRSITVTTTLESPVGSSLQTAVPSPQPLRPLVFTEEAPRSETEARSVRAPLALFRTPSREMVRPAVTQNLATSRTTGAVRRSSAPLIEEPSIDSPGMKLSAMAPRTSQAELRNVSYKGLTYQKSSLQRCPEDCQLSFRTSRGEVVRTKLKKSSFAKILLSHQGSVDIEGIETRSNGQRLLTLRNIKPIVPDGLEEDIAKTSRKGKIERASEPTPPAPEEAVEAVAAQDSSSLRAKLEAPPAKRKGEEVNTEEFEEEETTSAQSFQARLKRSVE